MLNLGILAHVDGGKTSLAERLLYSAGVIEEVGSVDAGTTQTDSLALERERGITIKAAVVSFAIGDTAVNLIDTPGHPDFIAEVERVLSVLDGAVLVISAVEGVQPQTRVLMRALQRLRTPTLVFVNKIDRPGANEERVLEGISKKLGLTIVPMSTTRDIGTRRADAIPFDLSDEAFRLRLTEVLSERDDTLLADFVEDEAAVSYRRLRDGLAAQTSRALVHPVFFGSAVTGAGVEHLKASISELLPAGVGDAEGPLSALVFKIERGAGGEKVAYARLFSGAMRTRERVPLSRGREGRITAVDVFENGSVVRRASASAGEIAKVWGLQEAQIGDRLGTVEQDVAQHQFAPPTLEAAVVPCDPADRPRLMEALAQLVEQDPLINVRGDESAHDVSVSLYGEVQKEVIQATLAREFGIDVTFHETTTIYKERPIGSGRAVELLEDDENPFSATVGLRVDRGPIGSGVEFRIEVEARRTPLYIYKNLENFKAAMTQYVLRTLEEGLVGWEVTDCVVTLDDCAYYIGDGPKKPTAPTPRTTSSDFRKLTPIVLMAALERARTEVCEPIVRARAEVPSNTIAAVLSTVGQLGVIEMRSAGADLSVVEARLPAASVQELSRRLPGLTGGEGVLETSFDGYRAVSGRPPTRRRTTANPLNRVEYLMQLRGRAFKATDEP